MSGFRRSGKPAQPREWLQFFNEADIPHAPLHDLDSLIDDPHLAAVGLIQSVEHPVRRHATRRWSCRDLGSKTPPRSETIRRVLASMARRSCVRPDSRMKKLQPLQVEGALIEPDGTDLNPSCLRVTRGIYSPRSARIFPRRADAACRSSCHRSSRTPEVGLSLKALTTLSDQAISSSVGMKAALTTSTCLDGSPPLARKPS